MKDSCVFVFVRVCVLVITINKLPTVIFLVLLISFFEFLQRKLPKKREEGKKKKKQEDW